MEIKRMSEAMKEHMTDEEGLVKNLDDNMEKNRSMLKQTVQRIDKVLTSASSNVLCYTILFFFCIVGLLYKLT